MKTIKMGQEKDELLEQFSSGIIYLYIYLHSLKDTGKKADNYELLSLWFVTVEEIWIWKEEDKITTSAWGEA